MISGQLIPIKRLVKLKLTALSAFIGLPMANMYCLLSFMRELRWIMRFASTMPQDNSNVLLVSKSLSFMRLIGNLIPKEHSQSLTSNLSNFKLKSKRLQRKRRNHKRNGLIPRDQAILLLKLCARRCQKPMKRVLKKLTRPSIKK